jgi:hypothetical protein
MSDENVTDELKEHVKDTSVWTRLLFMLLFAVLYWVAEAVIMVVVLFQFLCVLLTGNRNDKVLALGAQLSTYAYQIFRYLTYNSEDKPFPLGDWPSDAELGGVEVAKTAEKKPARKRAPAKKAAAAEEKKESSEEKPASSD